MPISNPQQLVEEFKKSGEFDRLRRELLAEFQKGSHMPAFSKKTEEVVQQRFASMNQHRFPGIYFKTEANLKTELLQEIQRYPYVETTINDMSTFSDSSFKSNVRDSIHRILREEKEEKSPVEDSPVNEDEDKMKSTPPSVDARLATTAVQAATSVPEQPAQNQESSRPMPTTQRVADNALSSVAPVAPAASIEPADQEGEAEG